MKSLLSLFFRPQRNLRRYRVEMREQKEAQLVRMGREQFRKLIDKGLRVPVALL